MSYFTINVTKSGETGTLIADIGHHYTDNLNEINEAEIKFSGTGSIRRALLAIGANVEIKRNGTREFYGLIDSIDYLDAGAISAHVSGFEKWLALEKGTYANSPYTSTASATIATEIIAESNYLTAGTIEAGFATDFRISKSESLYNALSNLARKTQQDIGIDYVNSEVDLLDHKGNSVTVATFNDGIDIQNLRVTYSYPLGNHILVYGKGDGENQIKAESEDAASIAAYGRIKRPVIDRSIISTAEAQKLADAEKALTKDPVKIYDFEVINLGVSLVCGDHILLNSADKDLTNEEVRIVGIERGERNGVEYFSLQVTNPAYKTLMRTRNKILAGLKKENRDTNTYMMGTSNVLTFSNLINADNTAPLRIYLSLPSSFIYDEAGNRRIESFTLDYDIDPYRKGVGDATVDNSLTGADITNVGANSGAGITNVGANSGAGITNVGANSGAGITNVGVTPAANSGSLSFAGNTDGASVTGNYSRAHTYETIVGSPTISIGRGAIVVFNNSGGAYNVHLYITTSGGFSSNWNSGNLNNNTYREWETGSSSSSSWINVWVRFYDSNGNANYQWGNCNLVYEHTHGNHIHSNTFNDSSHTNANTFNDSSHTNANTFNDSSHTNANTFNDVNHDHVASIGDTLPAEGGLNASQLSEIKVYWWNTGTSTWDLKHTITNTGSTLDTDVDLTNGNTLPDAAGFWKIELKTDNASPDLINGITKIKHQMDN